MERLIVHFFVTYKLLSIATLITTLLSDVDENYQTIYYVTVAWNTLECLFCIGGIIVFHFLHRPAVILVITVLFCFIR